jgi:polyisoprenoid-binding protein YceI
MTETATVESRLENDRLIPPVGVFEIDPVHTFATFRAQHLVVGRVQGRFESVAGRLTIAPDVLDSHAEVTLDATSLTTQMPMRDNHLRSADFLDVENYPTLTFTTTGITELPNGQWSVGGNLTIRATTRPVDLIVAFGGAVPDPFGNLRIGFHGTTSISRRDYGLLFELESHIGRLGLARDVAIELDVEAVHPL